MLDLGDLTRQVYIAQLSLGRELARREAVRTYKSLVLDPTHPISDLMKPARYKVFWGGRGAVKSWGMAEGLVRYADAPVGTYIPVPERILCTREYQNSIKDSVHQLLYDTIVRMGLTHRFYITDKSIRNPHTGGAFLFKGLHHNVEEIKSTEGITKCWVEEAQSTTNDSWQTLIPTVRAGSRPGDPVVWSSEIWASFNTTDETAATFDRFIPLANRPPDAIVHKINYDQNPYLPEVLRREMEYLKKKDYQAYLHVWEGMPKKISDAIIFGKCYRVEGFSDTLWKKADRLLFGLDHGFARDPYAFTRSFIYDRKLYIEYEAFGVGVEFAGTMAPPLRSGGEKRGELEQLLDSVPGSRDWPIKADSSRPETISFLRGKSFRVSAAEKWKGCVEDGIAHLKGFDEIVIHDRCKHMQEEARLYAFKVDRITGEILPEIVDANNHGWDSIRYALDGHIRRSGNLGMWARLGGAK